MPAGAVSIRAEVPWERQSGRRSHGGGPRGGERKPLGRRVVVMKPGNPRWECPPPMEQPSGLGPSCAPGGRRVAAEDLVVAAIKSGGHGPIQGACLVALGQRGMLLPRAEAASQSLRRLRHLRARFSAESEREDRFDSGWLLTVMALGA